MANDLSPVAENPWKPVLDRASKSTVAVISSRQFNFDTEKPGKTEGSGFVVDKRGGYIITNRHVASSGPTYSRCKFAIRDEVDTCVVYVDPVHDYAILKFDPNSQAVQEMEIDELEMRPDLARVGDRVQIIGNDQRNRFSSSEGTIDRVDGNVADNWGETDKPHATDFNSHCVQLTSPNSRGSSGSAVVNMAGFVVALIASGSADGATNFCLPLEHPCYALEFIKKGLPVPRGDIQSKWSFQPFSECEKLGLSRGWRRKLQGTEVIGMLVAKTIVPCGPSDKIIQVGDVLLDVNGERVTRFAPLEKILDGNVGHVLRLRLHRGETEVEVDVTVGDLHKITPDSFVSIGGPRGPSFHALSYQFAQRYEIACGSVFMPAGIGAFRTVGSNSIIRSIDGKKTPDLATFIEVVKNIPDGKSVVVDSTVVFDLPTINSRLVFITRRWATEMTLVSRNTEGVWTAATIAPILPAVKRETQIARYPKMKHFSSQALADIGYSWVDIQHHTLIPLDGTTENTQTGRGIIIDSENGIVATSAKLIPSSLGDLSINFSGSTILEGKVILIHPYQGWAIISYDASSIDGPMKSARLKTKPVEVGDTTYFLGIKGHGLAEQLHETKTTISDRSIENNGTDKTGPRYRVANVDRYCVETQNRNDCSYGAFVEEDGTVQALWMPMPDTDWEGKSGCWEFGLAAPDIAQVVAKMRKDSDAPTLRFVNVQYETMSITRAMAMGVSNDWVDRVTNASNCIKGCEIFRVAKVAAEDESGFCVGDVVLALNGKVPVQFSDFQAVYEDESFNATLVRDGKEETREIFTTLISGKGTSTFVDFYGAVVQEPHLEVRSYVRELYSRVYVSCVTEGSPADHFILKAATFITKVDGIDTSDLSDFLETVKGIPMNKYFKIETVNMEGRTVIVAMKKVDAHYSLDQWNQWTQGNEWHRVIHEPTNAAK